MALSVLCNSFCVAPATATSFAGAFLRFLMESHRQQDPELYETYFQALENRQAEAAAAGVAEGGASSSSSPAPGQGERIVGRKSL